MEDLAKVYVTLVAVPPEFDVSLYMSPAEQAGYFKYETATPDQIKALSDGLCWSPVLRVDATKIKEHSVLQFIKILKDLGLVIDEQVMGAEINHVYENVISTALTSHAVATAVEQLERERAINNMREFKFASSFLFINVFPLINEKIVHKYVEKAVELENWRKG